MRKSKFKRGNALTEMLVAITLTSIILGAGAFGYSKLMNNSKRSTASNYLQMCGTSIDECASDHGLPDCTGTEEETESNIKAFIRRLNSDYLPTEVSTADSDIVIDDSISGEMTVTSTTIENDPWEIPYKFTLFLDDTGNNICWLQSGGPNRTIDAVKDPSTGNIDVADDVLLIIQFRNSEIYVVEAP